MGEPKTDCLVGAKRLRVVFLVLVGCFQLFAYRLTCIAQRPVKVASNVSSDPLMSIMEVYTDPFHQRFFGQ
jgi:hypothetical protein